MSPRVTFEEEVTEILLFLIERVVSLWILYLTLNFHQFLLNLLKSLFIVLFQIVSKFSIIWMLSTFSSASAFT